MPLPKAMGSGTYMEISVFGYRFSSFSADRFWMALAHEGKYCRWY